MSDKPTKRGRGEHRADDDDDDIPFGYGRERGLYKHPNYELARKEKKFADRMAEDRGGALEQTTTPQPARGPSPPQRAATKTAPPLPAPTLLSDHSWVGPSQPPNTTTIAAAFAAAYPLFPRVPSYEPNMTTIPRIPSPPQVVIRPFPSGPPLERPRSEDPASPDQSSGLAAETSASSAPAPSAAAPPPSVESAGPAPQQTDAPQDRSDL